jgi:hypothetical protein
MNNESKTKLLKFTMDPERVRSPENAILRRAISVILPLDTLIKKFKNNETITGKKINRDYKQSILIKKFFKLNELS